MQSLRKTSRYECKAITFSQFDGWSISLSKEEDAFVRTLPVINVSKGTELWEVQIPDSKKINEIALLLAGGNFYLVNSEGYNYARYTARVRL